jgi:hypothetical protein
MCGYVWVICKDFFAGYDVDTKGKSSQRWEQLQEDFQLGSVSEDSLSLLLNPGRGCDGLVGIVVRKTRCFGFDDT